MKKLFSTLCFGTLLVIGSTPGWGDSPAGIGLQGPEDLADLINEAARDLRLGALSAETRAEVAAALNFQIARQIHCLALTDPYDGSGELSQIKNQLLEKIEAGALRFALELDSDAANFLQSSSEQPPTITLTQVPFRAGWKEANSWGGFSFQGDRLDASDPGWPAIERLVIRILAVAGSKGGWPEVEEYLWGLWSGCKEELADFGDADPEVYPTRLFTQPSDFLKGGAFLETPRLVLTKRDELGAHHRNQPDEIREWLGGGREGDALKVEMNIDQELDTRGQEEDPTDNGIAPVEITDGQIEVTVSVTDPRSDRYTDGTLVFHGWVDWDRVEGWQAKAEHLTWQPLPAGAPSGFEVDSKDPHRLLIDPSQWGDDETRTVTVQFVPGQLPDEGETPWARFRLYYLPDERLERMRAKDFTPQGPAPFGGEVEDYFLDFSDGKEGFLTRLRDDAGDLRRHFSASPSPGRPSWLDLRDAGVVVRTPEPGPWDDPNVPLPGEEPPSTDGRLLELEMELYEPIPEAPEAPFASWHFVVDLDGRRSTGHDGGERPVGVFPDLGVDLWADLIWDGHGFAPYLFLGSDGIAQLDSTFGLLSARLSADRKRVIFELAAGPLEELLSDLYGEPLAIDPDRIEWVAVTNHVAEPIDYEDPPSDFFPDWLYLPPGSCARAAREGTGLCVGDGRFKVEVAWETPGGRRGSGRAVPLTDDTGHFWFFDPDNVELVVKVLDACSFNDRFWVFAAGLTNVEVEITVTDSWTGEPRRYLNPQRVPFEPILDTRAFASCRVADPRGWEEAGSGGERSDPFPGAGSAGTAPARAQEKLGESETALLLNDGRFEIEVAWETPRGRQGVGRAVPLTGDTGYFWFFDPGNVELVVKVLDACSFNERFWVFAAGLTNVELEITVRDTLTGAVRTYRNPQRTPFQPLLDTGAFATCR